MHTLAVHEAYVVSTVVKDTRIRYAFQKNASTICSGVDYLVDSMVGLMDGLCGK